jgi:SRSO17 transposase
MLLPDRVPPSLAAVVAPLRSCFTAPSYVSFVTLVTGLIAMPVGRTVTGMLVGAGVSRLWHHSRAYRFFSTARWNTDQLGLAVLAVIVTGLLAAGSDVTIVIDDTLFARSGRKVDAAGWQHDGSARRPPGGGPKLGFGNCFVVAAVVVWLPFRIRPVALPVLARLYRPGAPGTGGHNRKAPPGPGKATKAALARQMIELIAAALPDRIVHIVADAGYATSDMRNLPGHLTYTTRARSNAAFCHRADPTPTGRPGRPRIFGPAITTEQLTAHPATYPVTRYGEQHTVTAATTECLWRHVFARQPVRVITLLGDGPPVRLVTTDLTTPIAQIIERYGARWAIEVTFTDAKTITGVGEARTRTRTAVTRTVPFGLYTVSIVTIWYARHGYDPADITQRRARQPWYRTKTEPSYHDMITKLRRELIKHRKLLQSPDQPTAPEILDLLTALPELAA